VTGNVFQPGHRIRIEISSSYFPYYLRNLNTGADNVGGAQRAKARTPFQRALCAALTSPLGVGGARYRSAEAEGFVDTVFLGAFRRRVFEAVGLWDPGAITNEDAELNQRILDSGGQIYLSRDIVVHYFPRDSFQTLAKQYFKYGRGRARTLLKLGAFPTLRPIVPFALVVGASALILVPPLWPIAPLAFAGYALATGAEAVRVGRSLGARGLPMVWAMFPVLHASHGVGFAAGLGQYLRKPDWPAEPERIARKVTLRAV